MAVTISGGVFDFTEGGYIAPTWSGSEYLFGTVLTGYLNQVWIDSDYVYAATTEEFSVTDIEEESIIAYARERGEFTTVWANDDTVFLGTSSGISYLYKSCITGTPASPDDISTCLLDTGLSTDDIRYLHGNGDFMVSCTTSGVVVYKLEPNGYTSSATVEGAQKCFMTSTGKFYYTVSGINWSLNRVDKPQTDWIEPDASYITGSGIFDVGLEINDIFITEQDNNTIFAATSSGVYIIDEQTLEYNIYYKE